MAAGDVRSCPTCPATWITTAHNGRRDRCSRCAEGHARQLDREKKRRLRFIARWRETDRQDLIQDMAYEYAHFGEIEHGWNDDYSVRDWQMIVAEAVATGLDMLAAEAAGEYDEAEAEADHADADALAVTEQLLRQAQSAIAHGDLQAVRIITERVSKLATRGSA